jgi:hypothetical protein
VHAMCFYVFSRVCDFNMFSFAKVTFHMFLYVFEVSCRLSEVQVCSLYAFLLFQGSRCAVYTSFYMFLNPQRPPGAPQSFNRSPTEAQKGHRTHKSLPRGSPELPRLSPETPRGSTEAQPRPTDAQRRPRRGPQWSTSYSKYTVYGKFYSVFVCFLIACVLLCRETQSVSLDVFSRVF